MSHQYQSSALSRGLALVLLLSSSGCGRQARAGKVPPLPTGSFCAEINRGTMCFYRWSDKLAVMICADVHGSMRTMGSFSGPPSVRKSEGSVSAQDGRKLDWLLEEIEGQKIRCRVNDKEFDLDQGTLFLVKTKGNETEVEQLSQDLSEVKSEIESFKEFARKNPAIGKLIELGDE
jgi:hypothetical protein